MTAWWGVLGWILGPESLGHLPPNPDDEMRQTRIDRAVQQADDLERDVFTRRVGDALRGQPRQ